MSLKTEHCIETYCTQNTLRNENGYWLSPFLAWHRCDTLFYIHDFPLCSSFYTAGLFTARSAGTLKVIRSWCVDHGLIDAIRRFRMLIKSKLAI